MRELRVLHVAPYYDEAWAYGGIPRVAVTLARGLGRRGHRVTVCTTDARDRTSRAAPVPADPGPGVDLRVFRNVSNTLAYRLQLFAPLGLAAFLRRHAREFDVAHLHGCHHLPGAIAARHLRRAGVPYVLSPHGTGPRIERRRLAKLVFDATLGRGVMGHAARVLAVTQSERRQLVGIGVDDKLIRVVGNPIDLEEFEPLPARGRFRERHGLGERPVVMFLGKLTPRKRVDVLVEAFASLGRDTALVIAGNDLGAGRALRSLVERQGLAARTLFTGLLPGRLRVEALADADVVVYPSRDEAFGLVPLEALLSGTPVIVADDAGCGEVIARVGGGRVVRQGDVAEVARAIRAVLEQPRRWRETATEAGGRVRELFGADAVVAAIEQVYDEVA